MSRQKSIDQLITRTSPEGFEGRFGDDLTAWIVEQAKTHKLRYLLAHLDDGVLWGEVDGETLITSADAFPNRDFLPALRTETLEQLRLFGETGELLVWRDGGLWRGRLLQDDNDPEAQGIEAMNEMHLLWGAVEGRRLQFSQGFVLLSEQDGLRHAPPLGLDELDLTQQRAHLCVRHYIDYDDDGQAHVAASRLTGLGVHSRWERGKDAA